MKKILIIFTLVICLISLASCKDKVSSIKVIESTVPAIIDVSTLDAELQKIQIEVITEKGASSTQNVDKSMISSDDYSKLLSLGTYTVTLTYQESFTTTVTLTTENKNAYTAKVVYPNGDPVTSSVSVQWCTNSTCMLPAYVNSQGIANTVIKEDNYFIHIEGIPSGYTYDPNAYTASPTSKNVVIELISLVDIQGLGTEESPYAVSEGAFSVTYNEKVNEWKYFTFTPSVSGTYSIKSLAVNKLATNEIDPYIGFLGTSNDMSQIDVSGNSELSINFNHTFTADANVTYTFIVFVSDATKFPATFDIQITK